MNNSSQKKPWKEMLSEFLSEPTRPNLRNLLQDEAVEDNDLDFKKELMSETKLAKHIIAMANKQGGVIIFGLKEINPNIFEPVGIEDKIDPTDLEKQLSKYLSPKLMEQKNILPVTYTESEYEKLKDKTFITIIVNYTPRHIPFMPLKDGEKDGDKISRNAIYIRRNRATEPANYEEIQDILDRRLETEYNSSSERKLREHLEELKELYSHIPKTIGKGYFHNSRNPLGVELSNALKSGILKTSILDQFDSSDTYIPPKPNPNYPEEDYEQFLSRMIGLKKGIIEDQIKK